MSSSDMYDIYLGSTGPDVWDGNGRSQAISCRVYFLAYMTPNDASNPVIIGSGIDFFPRPAITEPKTKSFSFVQRFSRQVAYEI